MPTHERKKSDQQNAAARDAVLRDYRATFGTHAGKRVLGYLRQSAGSGRPAFLPPAGGGPIDPYAAAFRDGRKSVIDEIEGILATPEDAQEEGGQKRGEPKSTK